MEAGMTVRLGPELETERLLLRPPSVVDLDKFADLMADPDGTAFIGGVKTRPEAWRGLATFCGHWVLCGFGMFSVIEKSSGQWIGMIGPTRPEAWPGPEIGWRLARHAWGKGYAAEGARRTVTWARDHLGWTDVIHLIDPRNQRSIALARRLGAERQGTTTMPPPFNIEIDVYGQTLLPPLV
jgi:RimJ/RimL family protein N-acetyltransferase